MNIIVKYSCNFCGLQKVECLVPARTTEDVKNWVEDVMILTLMVDHKKRSPNCKADRFADVMIPITGVAKIGGPVVN